MIVANLPAGFFINPAGILPATGIFERISKTPRAK